MNIKTQRVRGDGSAAVGIDRLHSHARAARQNVMPICEITRRAVVHLLEQAIYIYVVVTASEPLVITVAKQFESPSHRKVSMSLSSAKRQTKMAVHEGYIWNDAMTFPSGPILKIGVEIRATPLMSSAATRYSEFGVRGTAFTTDWNAADSAP